MKSINPYINFEGNAEEAFTFYQSVFGGELQLVRFKDMGDIMGVTGENLEKVAHASLPIGGNTILMGDDGGAVMAETLTRGNGFSIILEAESIEEAERLFNALSDGGKIKMPLAEVEWAERFGTFTDKFGIRWMVNYTGSKGNW